MTIFNLMKMVESSLKGVENAVGKGEIVTSNFSFSHFVFERFSVQTHKNQGLFGKGLNFNHFCDKFHSSGSCKCCTIYQYIPKSFPSYIFVLTH